MQQLRTLIPSDFVFRTAVLLLIWIGFAVWDLFSPPTEAIARELGNSGWYVSAFLGLATLFDLYLRRGYRVSYDENAIYWRKVGLRGRFGQTIEMPFAEISHVFALAGTDFIKPFEAVVISAGAHDDCEIILSRRYLENGDMKALLFEVSARSNAVFEEPVSEFMETPE